MASIMSGSDLEIETINPTQELVTFDHVRGYYYPERKISIGYKMGVSVEQTPRDWIGVFESDWCSVDEYITFQWASQTVLCNHAPCLRKVTFQKFSPLKYCNSDKRYRCLYVSRGEDVIGVSSMFVLLPTEQVGYELDWLQLDQGFSESHELVTEASFTLVDLSSGTNSATSQESLEEKGASKDDKSSNTSFDSVTLAEEFPRKSWPSDFISQLGSAKNDNQELNWHDKYITPEKNGSFIPLFPVLPNPKPIVELYQSNKPILGTFLQSDAPLMRSPRDKTLPLAFKRERTQEDRLQNDVFNVLFADKGNQIQESPLDLSKGSTTPPKPAMNSLEHSMQRQLIAFAGNITFEPWKETPPASKNDACAKKLPVRSLPTGKERAKKMYRKHQEFSIYKMAAKKRQNVSWKKDREEQMRKRMRTTTKEETVLSRKCAKIESSPTTSKPNEKQKGVIIEGLPTTSNPKEKQKSVIIGLQTTSKPKENLMGVKIEGLPTTSKPIEQQGAKIEGSPTTSKQQSGSENMKIVAVSNMSKSKKNNYNARKFHALKFLKHLFGGQHPVTSLRSLIRSESCLNCVISQSMLEDYRKSSHKSERRIDDLEKENQELSDQLKIKTKEVERLKSEAARKDDSLDKLSSAELRTMFQFLQEAEEINCLLDDALRVSLETNKVFMSRKMQTEPIATRDVAVSCQDVETEEPEDDSKSCGWVVRSPRLVVRLRSAIEKRERTLKYLHDKIEHLGSQISVYEDDIKELRVVMKEQRNNTKASHIEVVKLRRQNDILNESRKHFSAFTPSSTSKAVFGKVRSVGVTTADKATQGGPVPIHQVEPLPACPTGPKFENWKAFRRHLKSQISSGTCSVCNMTFSPNVDRRLIEEHITFHLQFDI